MTTQRNTSTTTNSNTYRNFEHYRDITHDWTGLAERENIAEVARELMRTRGWDFVTATEYTYEAKYGRYNGALSSEERKTRQPVYLADIPASWRVRDVLLNARHSARLALTRGVSRATSTYWRVMTAIFLD